MKDFEKERLQQSIKFNEKRSENKLKKKKKIKIALIVIAVLIVISIIAVVILNIKAKELYKEKFENDLKLVYEKVLEEQAKKEEDYDYVFKGVSAISRSYKYEELFAYVEQQLNTKINEDYYILTKENLEQFGLEDIEREYLVSYQNKVVFSTEPLIEEENKIYTLDMIIQNYQQKQSIDLSGANAPMLFEGMNPVMYNNDNNEWVIVEDTENTVWYNYSEKKWANVMLSDYTDGDISNKDGSYFVWIPRFAYKMNENNYHTNRAGSFDIKFLKDDTNIATDGTVIDPNNGDVTKDYVIHPAFNFGKPLTGIWVSKFEGSNVEGVYKSLQDTYSWTNITLSEAFDISKSIKDNNIYGINKDEIDTHLIKNSEWGAVTYLAHSKYGKNNNEIWINPYLDNTGIKTGYSGRKANEVNYGNDTVYPWNSLNGVKASTTGNVYGIYDMSGGATEKVAAYVDNGSKYLLTDGKSLYEEANNKYYDKYYLNGEDTAKNNYHNLVWTYGQAIYETSSSEGGAFAWYSDTASMPTGEHCFILRGGTIMDSSEAGVFSFLGSSGGRYIYSGFRSVITDNTH
ncbi:MAG: hypothetical protein E7311_06205 [Clostridiales bacterium]|nr:hypothetical protein [Clostridiales bacterium]